MFTFCIQKDTIRVEPRDFGKDPAVAIREEINRRYANKVLLEVGLCISLLDILDSSEGAVLYGDGCLYYRTEFRLLIFRPYMGEAFVGKVQSQSEAGITVSVGFFDDIVVPPNLLPEYSAFDPSRRAYFWLVPPDPAPEVRPAESVLLKSSAEERLYIEKRDWIRIRVEEEHWADTSPGSGKKPAPAEAPPATGANVNAGPVAPQPAEKEKALPPYSL
ncbi:DNA-directed RNA polymerase III subunit RPC8 [Pseudohyphozyma bogoriensis]|nr:DNA-directed RNA polymerase III subunit RPC8 [Pseudohyphozyma bogoriensis]